MRSKALADEVRSRVASVDDPEFPGISIDDLGLVEEVRVDAAGHAEVDLIPTFLGCPALDVIVEDVESAVASVPTVTTVSVSFLSSPLWSVDRISPRARRVLAADFTVVVPDQAGEPLCPICRSASIEPRSPFGPTACRSVSYCPSCSNPVEVMKG